MSVNLLISNVHEAKRIILDIKKLNQQRTYSDLKNKIIITNSINSLVNRLKMINDAIPEIVKNISALKKLDENASRHAGEKNIVNFKYKSLSSGDSNFVSVKKEDRRDFLKELSLSEVSLKKINKTSLAPEIKANFYAVMSNKIFGNLASKFSDNLIDLKKDLKDSNSRFLLSTYVSMGLFTTLVSFIFSLILLSMLMVFGVSVAIFLFLPIVALFGVPIGFYLMPSLNKSNLDKEITNELPFAIIYMSAISGSNLEPTKIFKIVSESSEYKHIGVEMKKIVSQVEVYGYDLVSALKNVARTTINTRLSEVLNGMATNISSGSSLKNYLEKKSESLLMDYKLERTKYNEVAATFMDIYISVLITAPLILVMMVVIMGLTDLKLGNLSTDTLLALSIGLVALVNVFFLIFLQIRQPKV